MSELMELINFILSGHTTIEEVAKLFPDDPAFAALLEEVVEELKQGRSLL